MLLATLWALCTKSLRTGSSGKVRNLRWNKKVIYFLWWSIFFSRIKWSQINHFPLNEAHITIFREWNAIRSLGLMQFAYFCTDCKKDDFNFRIFASKTAILKTATIISQSVWKAGQSLKILQCSLSEREINDEVHAIIPISRNWLHFKIYLLNQGSVRRINCPAKMATGHLPTSSPNFAWRGVINHDRMTKLCKPSMIPPCHLGIQQLHIHWK